MPYIQKYSLHIEILKNDFQIETIRLDSMDKKLLVNVNELILKERYEKGLSDLNIESTILQYQVECKLEKL